MVRFKKRTIVGGVGILLAFVFFFIGDQQDSHTRTIAIAGNPIVLWQADPKQPTHAYLSIPSSNYITGVRGVGEYPLSSLWQLGELDTKAHDIFSLSLEETLGIPIEAYIGPRQGIGAVKTGESSQIVADIFSAAGFLKFLRGEYRTNISFLSFLELWWIRRGQLSGNQQATSINDTFLVSQNQPDGSVIYLIDPQKYDALMADFFEDITVREESKKVIVNNTTNTPALGMKVARVLEHHGMFVIAVGNSEPSVARCRVTTAKEHETSPSVAFILRHYGCEIRQGEDLDRADIIVDMGSDYEQKVVNPASL